MTVGIKRLSIAIAAALALAVAGLTLTSGLVDRSALRASIERQIRDVTGLDLMVNGDVDVSLFPTSHVTLRNVGLRGGPAGDPALLVEDLVANLRLLPLLAQRFEIADITLVKPRVIVTRSADGRTNWAPIAETLARTMKPGAASPVQFSEIRITDGVLDYRNSAQQAVEIIDDIDLSLAWPSISRSFAATGQFTWRGERVDGSLSISDLGAALAGERSGIKTRMSSAVLKLGFDGALTNKTSTTEGTLTVDSPSLRNLLRIVGQAPPGNTGFGRFGLKARATMIGPNVALGNVNIELDGNTGEGVMAFGFGERQVLHMTLATESLDLTPYASTMRLIAGTRDWNRQLFDLDTLIARDIDMRLSAARVTIGNSKFGRTALGANLKNGRLALSVGEAQAFGGVVRGSLGVAKSDAVADVKAEFQFIDIDLESSGNELFGTRRLSGRGNVNVSLEASGSSTFGLAQTLDGNIALTAQNGALLGFNVEQLLRRLERRPLSGAGDFRTGRTPFTDLTATLRINDGIATAESIRMEGPATRLSLNGTSSLPGREYDLKGVASLVTPANTPSGFELPFVIQGPWDDPLIFPDTESLLRRSPASAPLLDSRKARDAVRSAIERLTGGQKAPAAPAAAEPASGQN